MRGKKEGMDVKGTKGTRIRGRKRRRGERGGGGGEEEEEELGRRAKVQVEETRLKNIGKIN